MRWRIYLCAHKVISWAYILKKTDMRSDAFDQLEKLSDSYYANTKIGQIMGRITSDLFDVTEFAHHCPEEFFIAFIVISILCDSLLRICSFNDIDFCLCSL